MVNNGFVPFESPKKLAIATYFIFWQMHLMIQKGDKRIPRSLQSSQAILQTEWNGKG